MNQPSDKPFTLKITDNAVSGVGVSSPSEALRRGAAAAAAAVMSPGSELCQPDDYARLLERTALARL